MEKELTNKEKFFAGVEFSDNHRFHTYKYHAGYGGVYIGEHPRLYFFKVEKVTPYQVNLKGFIIGRPVKMILKFSKLIFF